MPINFYQLYMDDTEHIFSCGKTLTDWRFALPKLQKKGSPSTDGSVENQSGTVGPWDILERKPASEQSET